MTDMDRCDLCGSPVDASGDEFAVLECSDLGDGGEVSDQAAADAVANALEDIGGSGADYELARLIREDPEVCVHRQCLDGTAYSQLVADTSD